ETPAAQPGSRTAGEGSGHTARMYVPEESHSGILPMNQSNKDRRPSAENEEERPLIKENAGQPNTHPTQSGERVSQGLAGVRKVARDNKEMKFTALLHHLTVDLLRESFYSLKRKAAPGVDGVTWQEYEIGVEDRLVDLHGRVHRGAYRAQPSRRKYAQGEVVVIRFADDTIAGFQYQTDADHFLENLRERLGRFGLELHPDKTRRIEFGRFAEQNRERRGEGKPETFDFLGFTHISGKNGLG